MRQRRRGQNRFKRERKMQHHFHLHFMDGEGPSRDGMLEWCDAYLSGRYIVKWERSSDWDMFRSRHVRVTMARHNDAFAFKMRWSLDLARPQPSRADRMVRMAQTMASLKLLAQTWQAPIFTARQAAPTLDNATAFDMPFFTSLTTGMGKTSQTAFKILKNREYGSLKPPIYIDTEAKLLETYGVPQIEHSMVAAFDAYNAEEAKR